MNRLNKDKIDLSKIETKELTGSLLLAYLVDSLMPIPGQNELFLPLSVPSLVHSLSSEHEHFQSPSDPSQSTDGETDETDSAADFFPGRMAAGVLSFHNATIFLTEASGEGGKICGLGNPDGRV